MKIKFQCFWWNEDEVYRYLRTLIDYKVKSREENGVYRTIEVVTHDDEFRKKLPINWYGDSCMKINAEVA